MLPPKLRLLRRGILAAAAVTFPLGSAPALAGEDAGLAARIISWRGAKPASGEGAPQLKPTVTGRSDAPFVPVTVSADQTAD